MTGAEVTPMTVHGWLRFKLFLKLLPADVEALLEIGAGAGSVGARLSPRLRYVGLEPDPESYEIAARTIGEYGSVLHIAVEDFDDPTAFDAVCAFEVLEHMEDDRAALLEWQRHARAGGWVFVSVPAGKKLRPTDRRQGHFRRYTRAGMAELMRSVGLEEVTINSYGSPLGYVLLAVSDAMARVRPHADRMSDRTAASARWMRPSRRRARYTYEVARVLAVLQEPFRRTDIGTGLVARGRVPSGR
jgi:SAM-dependent methyltransferase